MVLYHANGRVVKAHEDYLEKEEAKLIKRHLYRDQIAEAKKKDPNAREQVGIRARIVVDVQNYSELYNFTPSYFDVEDLEMNVATESDPIPEEGLDRSTLMRLSSFADDFFTYSPDAVELHLPVCYPDIHVSTRSDPERGGMQKKDDEQLAYIRLQEIEQHIVPWLQAMEGVVEESLRKTPQIEVPDDLLEKIHLYNAMLQLGIAKRFQQPLIDALVLQMYKTNLKDCHLDTLEMTVGRFYSRGIAVLDPVLNHFIGTYSLRSEADRHDVEPVNKAVRHDPPSEDERSEDKRYLPERTKRGWLHYTAVRPDRRRRFPNDTVSVPARLEVLANSFRHWSGMRRNENTAPAHMGLPLNIGRVLKYYRRRPTDRIHTKPKLGTKKANKGKSGPKTKPESAKGKEGNAADSALTEEIGLADDTVSTDKDDTTPTDKDDIADGNRSAADEEDDYDPWGNEDIWGKHYAEYDTHRLMRRQYFRRNAPGAPAPSTQPQPPPGPGPTGPA
jgi:hypothetical protein